MYLPVARRKYGAMVLDRDTEMLIDGFTRSACVYAAVAFQLAQPKPVRLAHLLHSPAHIIAGIRQGVPTLVTVREPKGAVLSCVRREPQTTIPQLLRAHERFYRALLPYRRHIVVGTFARVTTDMGELIDEVNARFGTSFARFEGTEEDHASVFQLIDERAMRPPWEDQIGRVMAGLAPPSVLDVHRTGDIEPAETAVPFEDRVARPSAARAESASPFVLAYDRPEYAGLRERAEETYTMFVSADTLTAR